MKSTTMHAICQAAIIALATFGRANARLKGSTALHDTSASSLFHEESDQFREKPPRDLQGVMGALLADFGDAEYKETGLKNQKKTSAPHPAPTDKSPGATKTSRNGSPKTDMVGTPSAETIWVPKPLKNAATVSKFASPSSNTDSNTIRPGAKKAKGATDGTSNSEVTPKTSKTTSSKVSLSSSEGDKKTKGETTGSGSPQQGEGLGSSSTSTNGGGGRKSSSGKKEIAKKTPMAFSEYGIVFATEAASEVVTQTPTEIGSTESESTESPAVHSFDVMAADLATVERSLSIVAFEYQTTSGSIPADLDYVELTRATETFFHSFLTSFFQLNMQDVKFHDLKVNQYTVLLPRLVQFSVSAYFGNQSDSIPQAAQLDRIVYLNLMNGTTYNYMYLDFLHKIPFGPFATTASFKYYANAEKLKEAQKRNGRDPMSFRLNRFLIPAALAVGTFFVCLMFYLFIRDRRRGRMIHGIEEMQSINSKEDGDSTKLDDENTFVSSYPEEALPGPHDQTPKVSHSSKSLHFMYQQENREYKQYLEDRQFESIHRFASGSLGESISTTNTGYTTENIEPLGSFTSTPPVGALYFSSQPFKADGPVMHVLESVRNDQQPGFTSLTTLSSMELVSAKDPEAQTVSAFCPPNAVPPSNPISMDVGSTEKGALKAIDVSATEANNDNGEVILKTPFWANKGFLKPVRREPLDGDAQISFNRVEVECPDGVLLESSEVAKPEFLKITLRSTKCHGLPSKADPPASRGMQEAQKEPSICSEHKLDRDVDSPATTTHAVKIDAESSRTPEVNMLELQSNHDSENHQKEMQSIDGVCVVPLVKLNEEVCVLESEGMKPAIDGDRTENCIEQNIHKSLLDGEYETANSISDIPGGLEIIKESKIPLELATLSPGSIEGDIIGIVQQDRFVPKNVNDAKPVWPANHSIPQSTVVQPVEAATDAFKSVKPLVTISAEIDLDSVEQPVSSVSAVSISPAASTSTAGKWQEEQASRTTAPTTEKNDMTNEARKTTDSIPEWMLKFKMMGLKKQDD